MILLWQLLICCLALFVNLNQKEMGKKTMAQKLSNKEQSIEEKLYQAKVDAEVKYEAALQKIRIESPTASFIRMSELSDDVIRARDEYNRAVAEYRLYS